MSLSLFSSLTARQRKALRITGFVVLAAVVFVFALAWTFPYDRVKDRLIDELSAKYDVTIGEMRSGFFPGTVVIEELQLTTRPSKPDEKPTTVFIDSVEVDIGLLALLRRRYDVEIVARVTGGELEADILITRSKIEASIHTDELPLENIPGVVAAVGLPMAGGLNADFDFEVPLVRKDKRSEIKWSQAEGSLEITCTSCTVGDGKSKMKMRPRSTRSRVKRRAALFAASGLTVPRLRLGEARVEVDIVQGIGKIKTFSAQSPDGRLAIAGEIRFAEPFKRSTMPGCMRFKLADQLKKKEPDFGNIEFLLPERAREEDGTFAIPTKGTLLALRWDIKKRCGEPGAEGPANAGRPRIPRPQLDPNRPGADPAEPEDRSGEVILRPPPPGTSGPTLGGEGSDEATRARGEDAVATEEPVEPEPPPEGEAIEGELDADEPADGELEGDEGEGELDDEADEAELQVE
jgi:type II secretion system protein N